MRCISAVGVHDDLTTSQSRVRSGTTLDEATGGVDVQVVGVQIHIGLAQLELLQHRIDDVLHDGCCQLCGINFGKMLGGDHDGVDSGRPPVLSVLHCDLSFAIGQNVGKGSILAALGESVCHLVCQGDRQRHEVVIFLTGIAEHHALITGAAHLAVGAHGDVGTLLVQRYQDRTGVAIEASGGTVIADLDQLLTDDRRNIELGSGADLAHDENHASGAAHLTGNTTVGVLSQNCVQHGIGDLVTHLVGMAFGNGFRGKQSFHNHSTLS